MRNHPQPDDDFVKAIKTGLAYWHKETQNLDDKGIVALDQKRKNLFQLIEFGMKLPQTWKTTAEILIQLYPLIDRRGYWNDGLKLLGSTENYCHIEDFSLLLRLRAQKGMYYREKRELDKSLKIHKNVVREARKQSDKVVLARSLAELQYTNKFQGLFNESLLCGREALDLLQKNSSEIVLNIDVMRGIGGSLGELGEYQEAITFLQKAVDLARSFEDPLVLERSLHDLSDAYLKSNQIEDAFVCLEECEELLEPTIYELDKVRLNNQIGILHFSTENWQAAELSFRKAMSSYLHQSGNLELRIISFNNLGNALLKQEKISEAEGYLRASLDLRPSFGDEVGWANTEGTLAELLLLKGNLSEAKSLLLAAIEKLERYPQNAWGQGLLTKFYEKYKQLEEVV
ncbi:MAG: tetratricopeptide repeat protein [Chloroflexi bacterium]|nr:tetratricopeptide repeat protein [Chloroflexota bacterium]